MDCRSLSDVFMCSFRGAFHRANMAVPRPVHTLRYRFYGHLTMRGAVSIEMLLSPDTRTWRPPSATCTCRRCRRKGRSDCWNLDLSLERILEKAEEQKPKTMESKGEDGGADGT